MQTLTSIPPATDKTLPDIPPELMAQSPPQRTTPWPTREQIRAHLVREHVQEHDGIKTECDST